MKTFDIYDHGHFLHEIDADHFNYDSAGQTVGFFNERYELIATIIEFPGLIIKLAPQKALKASVPYTDTSKTAPTTSLFPPSQLTELFSNPGVLNVLDEEGLVVDHEALQKATQTLDAINKVLSLNHQAQGFYDEAALGYHAPYQIWSLPEGSGICLGFSFSSFDDAWVNAANRIGSELS